MDLKTAIEYALDGRAVLFTGAGFSYGATNIQNKPIPAGMSLAHKLLEESGYPPKDIALDKASSTYLRRKSGSELINLLIDSFTVHKVSPSHITVGSVPWKRVYTTNYDMVLEQASNESRTLRNSVDGVDPPHENLAKSNLVVHINGAITRINEERLHGSFKLISESYSTEAFEKSKWAFFFRQDIRSAPAVIFVGYSMYDLDIRRILYSEDISDKTFFITAPLNDDNQLDAEDLADLGYLAPIGIDGFAQEIEAVRKTYLPREQELVLDVWEKITTGSNSSAPRDSEVIDFLSLGTTSYALVAEACGTQANNYVISSPLVAAAEHAILHTNKDVLLIGALGTGKSFICQLLAQRLSSRGCGVFRINQASNNEIEELEQICNLPGEKLLIIENYQRHLETLRWIAETNPEGVAVLTSARTHIHELFGGEFYELMGDSCLLLDTSELDNSQITNAIDLFEKYGLWGERASWPAERKQSFLINDCKSQLPFLLIDILKSKHVTERFKELTSGNGKDIESVLVCMFALEVMQFTPSIAVIQELLGSKINWLHLRQQDKLKPIVDFSSHRINAKSAVLANHLLHHAFPAKAIVETLISMATRAEENRNDIAFYNILNSLMRYSQVSAVLPETNRLDSAMMYYEGIKNLPTLKGDPQFWLQYAISCLAFGKLERAERYFEDAYGLAKKRSGYNTHKIDNHYARLLLEKAAVAPELSDSLTGIDEARQIVIRQLVTEVEHHPYRVALGFFKCYDLMSSRLTQDQHSYFGRIFEEIKRRAESASRQLQRHQSVKECLQKANDALSKLGMPK